MRKRNIYKYIAIFLLLLNVAMIAFFFITKPPRGQHGPPRQDMKTIIPEILNLDEEQKVLFLASVESHKANMKSIKEDQNELLESYFLEVTSGVNKSKTDSILSIVQEVEKRKIELTGSHFNEIKTLLKPEQKADFNDFMGHVLKQIFGSKNNMPPPRK